MNPSDLDHDSRRELERHALRNVSWLAAKLGYQEALDRRQERWLMIAMGGRGVIVIVALIARARCARSSARRATSRASVARSMRVSRRRAGRAQRVMGDTAVAPADRGSSSRQDPRHRRIEVRCPAAK
jgi:hypothetical protein